MNPGVKRFAKGISLGLSPFKKILVLLFEFEAWISGLWASSAHKRLFLAEWYIPKNPEFFDHQIDLFYLWRKSKESHWLERGIFGSLAIRREGTLLEIACGDGFNARNFYSLLSKEIIACDFDKNAIRTAKRKNSAPNIEYILADIRYSMPEGDFDNIAWDAAIEHFTPDEIEAIMKNIKQRLKNRGGILSGHTIVERTEGKSLDQHEYEFKNMADLKRFFKPHFKNVIVFETIHPSRHNLYFWASDSVIPFSENWEHWIKIDKE